MRYEITFVDDGREERATTILRNVGVANSRRDYATIDEVDDGD